MNMKTPSPVACDCPLTGQARVYQDYLLEYPVLRVALLVARQHKECFDRLLKHPPTKKKRG